MQEMEETRIRSLGGEDPLEEDMATHSNILAWRILWTEGPGRLQSMGSQSWTRLSRRALTRGEAELSFSSLTWGSQGVPTT